MRSARLSGPVQLITRSTSQARVRLRAARPPDDFDCVVARVHVFDAPRMHVEHAGARERTHRAQGPGGHAMPMYIPQRAHVAQEARTLLVIERAPLRGKLSARERQHFAPVAAGRIHVARECAECR